MGPADCPREAAALHRSPWETSLTDPIYPAKITLDRKSRFPLQFTLEPFSV